MLVQWTVCPAPAHRDIIRNAVNASEEDAVIFAGSGCTGAVHKLLHVLNLQALDQPPVSLCVCVCVCTCVRMTVVQYLLWETEAEVVYHMFTCKGEALFSRPIACFYTLLFFFLGCECVQQMCQSVLLSLSMWLAQGRLWYVVVVHVPLAVWSVGGWMANMFNVYFSLFHFHLFCCCGNSQINTSGKTLMFWKLFMCADRARFNDTCNHR